MAIVTPENRFERELDECPKAWRILRTIPEYKSDYDRSFKLNPLKNKREINRLTNKWGFYPLHNPKSKTPSFEFVAAFSQYSIEVNRFQGSVDFQGVDMFVRDNLNQIRDPNGYLCSDQNPSPEINIKVNATFSDSVIYKELITGLNHIRNVFDVKVKSSKTHDHLEFLVKLLVKNDFSDKKIHDCLTPEEHKHRAYDDSMRESIRKKISERIKLARQ